MAFPLDGERFSLWSLALMVMMVHPGSSRIPSSDDGPLRQGAREGLDWFLVATEASGSGTPDLGYFLEVSVFIGIFGIGLTSRRCPNRPRGRPMRPPPSWTARDSSGPTLLLRGILLVHKKSSKIGMSIGLCLIFLFCKTKKQGINRNWHWALG